jgi:hypothetical protein
MKGITTIAALPSGAGQAAALPAEVGEAKPDLSLSDDIGVAWRAILARVLAGEISAKEAERLTEEWSIKRALKIALQPMVGELAAQFKVSPVRKAAVKCPVKFTDPDMLDTSK